MGKKIIRKLISCACGCGGTLLDYDKKARPRKYIYGHSPIGRFFVGFKHKEESKIMMSLNRSGDKHWHWNGGKYMSSKGYYYRYKPSHHFATDDGYIMEHRLVWEEYYNAILMPWADVHHKNENKQDNRIENLQAMMHGLHSIISHLGKKYKRKITKQ